jgi:hypothetical protein
MSEKQSTVSMDRAGGVHSTFTHLSRTFSGEGQKLLISLHLDETP